MEIKRWIVAPDSEMVNVGGEGGMGFALWRGK